MKLSTRLTTAAVAASITIALVACSSAAVAPSSLVETKSPTQLLRNEAAHRLMAGTDEEVAEQADYSAACKTEKDDPKGLYRSWRSTLLATVPSDSAIGVDQFVGALATSFAEDGWVLKESRGESSADKVSTMSKTGSVAVLKFTSTEDTGEGATILIESSGPCVLTAGSDSDEVRDLENQPE
jgi:hypothetical protein